MSDASSFDFSKFVPGFDFLKNLSGAGAQTGMPSASSWIAPTLDPDELDKRIQELKTVHFWLDQNTKAVSATIQALEVQKMTLATLRGMNMSMSDLAESLKIKPDSLSSAFSSHTDRSPAAPTQAAPPADHATRTEPAARKPKARPVKKTRASASSEKTESAAPSSAAPAGGVDPLAWWGSLTQQFQHIANQAVQDLQRQPPVAAGAEASAKSTSAHRAANPSTTRSTPSAAKGTSTGGGKGTAKSSSSKSKPARKSAHSAARHHDT